MIKTILNVIVVSAVATVFPRAPALAADRVADAIVKEAEAEIKLQRRSRPIEEFQASDRKIEGLVGELRERFPGDARLAGLLIERWWASLRLGHTAEVRKDVRSVMASTKDAKLRADAFYIDAVIAAGEGVDGPSVIAVAEKFILQVPGDDRAASLLSAALMKFPEGNAERVRLEHRIIDEFPKSLNGRILAGERTQAKRVGKPFKLDFNDTISGKKISMDELRGKVVVLDFWATWCGPCIAEIPHLKELYDQYHGQGVEFIGVSLDKPEEDGGLQSLKVYVHDHEIKWPQYYLGEKFDGEFTTSWGIGSIPVSFIVDAEGNLFSTQARGKLDQMIPLLLEKARTHKP